MVEITDRGTLSSRRAKLGAIAMVLLVLPCACGSSRASHGPSDGQDGPSGPLDAAPDAASPPAPRLIAPLSMTTVTQQRPLLRWAMPEGVAAPVIELCKDRACMMPLPIITETASDGLSGAPQAALPPGWVYWRVQATSGGQTVSSATWQFWVGRSSASNPVDTGNGVILDVNGDGYADFLVGAPRAFTETGTVYLYLGSATASATDWNGASPAARIELFRDGAGQFGSVVASAGDVNGDGYADFLIGAVGVGPGSRVHLYLGSASPSAADWNGHDATRRLDLTDPLPGGLGTCVAGAGDVNGDGYADFIVSGDPGPHVYFGSATPSVSDWSAGASTRRIDLANPGAGDGYGVAVAGVGDVNGDGYADLLVGASSTTSIFDAERAYLYLGSQAPSLTSWNKPSSTSRIDLVTPDGFRGGFGASVAGAGDVNGDGYADFLIAAEFAETGDSFTMTGAAHVYFGSALPSATGWNGTTASQRVDLVNPDGVPSTFGLAVTGAGDVNGDGYADFVVGNSQIGGGTAHVYLGGATVDVQDWNDAITHASRIDLFTPDDANAHFGGSAGNVGDVNGDGFSDFLVGTLSNEYLPSATGGAAHLYLGLANAGVASWDGVVPAMRIDLANPAGQDAAFGNAVAIATKRARALGRVLR